MDSTDFKISEADWATVPKRSELCSLLGECEIVKGKSKVNKLFFSIFLQSLLLLLLFSGLANPY